MGVAYSLGGNPTIGSRGGNENTEKHKLGVVRSVGLSAPLSPLMLAVITVTAYN